MTPRCTRLWRIRYHSVRHHPRAACILIRPAVHTDAERSDLTLACCAPPTGRRASPRWYTVVGRTQPCRWRSWGCAFPARWLAAGLDKEARCLAPLLDFGFGFLELGTVTPRPQPGNPKPRLFRLTRHAAIINRMGFNSSGLAVFLANLAAQPRRGLIGINLGKNKLTPDAQAIDDYLTGLRAVYAHADYVTLNISSPNTPGLRALQDEAPLAVLLAALKHEQGLLAHTHGRYVPIALKIAPDLDDTGIDAIARLLIMHKMDAVIATNTTITRPGLEQEPLAFETGGLSGQPLRALSTQVIRRLHASLQGRIPIIGVGGIGNADEAWEKLIAGANLVQLYTAFIYQGPGVVGEIVRGLVESTRARCHQPGRCAAARATALLILTGFQFTLCPTICQNSLLKALPRRAMFFDPATGSNVCSTVWRITAKTGGLANVAHTEAERRRGHRFSSGPDLRWAQVPGCRSAPARH